MLDRFTKFFKRVLKLEATPQNLAKSFCIGIYIAFSPFPGLHTVMMFFFTWLLSLNFPILFFATSFNNPWTLIIFYSTDYFFGYWLIHSLFGCNPNCSMSLAKVFGSGKICLLSFFVGGNVLGLIVALLCYPFILSMFKQFKKTNKAEL